MTPGYSRGSVPLLEQLANNARATLTRMAHGGLHVSAGLVAVGNEIAFRLHIANTRHDLADALAAHAIGLALAAADPDSFDVTVSNATRLRIFPPSWDASSLPVEVIQEEIATLRADASALGLALYLGENTLTGIPESVSIHLAQNDDLAFSSHVAMLAGLSSRETHPATFERACAIELERLSGADGA